jgi:hypothetical protein
MSLAKKINEKLDEILALKEELSLMASEVPKDATITNKMTGDKMSVDDAMDIAYGVINKVKEDLNQITNNGQNVRNIFDNPYYINDPIQDKMLAEQNANKI